MSEHYWAQEKTLAAELETILCGHASSLQKWQKRALKRAIKLAKKSASPIPSKPVAQPFSIC